MSWYLLGTAIMSGIWFCGFQVGRFYPRKTRANEPAEAKPPPPPAHKSRPPAYHWDYTPRVLKPEEKP